MALTIRQASAVNTLVRYLTSHPDNAALGIDDDKAREALALLADHANKALMAGPDGKHVRSNWPKDGIISIRSIHDALRDAERNDSAADALEFVSTLVGWDADNDPTLMAERQREREQMLYRQDARA